MLKEFDQQSVGTFRSPPAEAAIPVCDSVDRDLMERIQRRDERALETLIKRYQTMLHTVVGRMIANEHEVADVVEEVFLGVWNRAANFDPSKGKAVGWIITMARRRGIDRVRRRQAQDHAEMRFRASAEAGTSRYAWDDVERAACSSETAAMFQELLSALPEAQSAVVRMAYFRGLSHREMANETGIPLGTIKTRLELGVRKLRLAICAKGSRQYWLAAPERRFARQTLIPRSN
jgi:RNA polymerase sigma-70 factor (ECF subfamily)